MEDDEDKELHQVKRTGTIKPFDDNDGEKKAILKKQADGKFAPESIPHQKPGRQGNCQSDGGK